MARKKTKRYYWLFVLGFVFIAFFIYQDNIKQVPSDESKYNLEKTGAGSIANYISTSLKVHKVVDNLIARNGFIIKEEQAKIREVKRQKIEGLIRWHTRNILLENNRKNKNDLNSILNIFHGQLEKDGAAIIATEDDNFEGNKAVRVDIGFRDKLENDDDVTIITDRLYFIEDRKEPASMPPVSKKTLGRLAIIIDDFGYSAEPIPQFCSIPSPITFSVLPNRPYTQQAARQAVALGKQVMLHLPMEPLSRAAQSEKVTVMVSMDDKEIKDIVEEAIKAVPQAVGINNHQGSRATADKRVMEEVLSAVKKHNLFFVDSRTIGNSVAYSVAMKLGVPSSQNNIFIDNSTDIDYIKNQLRKAVRITINNGSAVAIGHARYTTYKAIKEMLSEFETEGIELVFASQIVK